MSKRYGRNQKRKHRDEIERLKKHLHVIITGGFQPATGKYQRLDDLINFPISIDVHEAEDGFTIRREARIRFAPADRTSAKTLLYTHAYSGLVEWRGIVWQVVMPHAVEVTHAFYDVEVMEIELRAIGTRDSNREAVCYPEMAAITRTIVHPRRKAA